MSATVASGNTIHPMLSGLRQAEIRGKVLSHLIGASFFIMMIFDRIITFAIPYNRLIELPLRLVVIWLLIDRIGRRGRIKVTAWDYLHLGFAAAFGAALVYADLFMVRETGLINYITWLMANFQAYLFFLVVREASIRRGFRPYVIIQWVIAAIVVACLAALWQATNIAGGRAFINDLVNQRLAEAKMEGPSAPWQARGLFVHANAMAIIIIMGIPLLFSAADYRRPKLWEIGAAAIMLITLFATFSRTGIVSLFVLAVMVAAIYFIRRRYRTTFLLLATIVGLGFAFITIATITGAERYSVFTQGASRIKNDPQRGLVGVYLREQTIRRGLPIAEKFPFTGVAPATTAINNERILYKSAYSFEGQLLNVYAYSFIMYGAIGVAFLLGVLGLTLGQIKYLRSTYAFASGAVLCGIAIAVTGVSENTAFQPTHMAIVNIIMALALTKVKRVEDEKAENPHLPNKWKFLFGKRNIHGQTP